MAPLIGVLSDSYRRQLRRLTETPAIDVLIDKVGGLRDDFGLDRIGLDVGVWQLASTDPGYLAELRSRLDDRGLVPSVLLGSLALVADRDLSGPPLARATGQLAVATALGSPIAMFFFGYGGRVTREGRLRLAIEQVSDLADAASNLGIVLASENYDYFTSSDFVTIIEAVGPDRFGFNNDTGNWQILGEDPLAATSRLLPYTRHVHVRDYVLDDGVYRSVPVGRGDVPVGELLGELLPLADRTSRFGFSVEMDLDAGTDADEDDATRESLRYLLDFAGRSGAAMPVAADD